MKKTLAFVALVMTIVVIAFSSAHAWTAVDENSSWDKIMHSAGLTAKFPKEWIGKFNVSVYGLCVDGNLLKTEVTDCVESEPHGDGGSRCLKEATFVISKPITQAETYCADSGGGEGGNCVRYETYTRTVPLVYKVRVARDTGIGFTKRFEIPACE